MRKIRNLLFVVVSCFVLFAFTNVYAETIDEVNVIGVKVPVVGDLVSDLTASISIPEGANYSILDITWWGSENGMYYYNMPSDAKIEDNASYYVSITLLGNGEYEFPCDEENHYTGSLTTSDVDYQDAYADGSELEIYFQPSQVGDISYHVTEGAGQTVSYGDEAKFVIDAEYGMFEDDGFVIVDEDKIDSNNYVAEEGSTVITLNKDYIESLDEGEHSLIVVFADYKIAETTFTVTNNNIDTNTNNNTSEITPPNTGVNSSNNNYFYILIILLSSLCLIGLNKRYN